MSKYELVIFDFILHETFGTWRKNFQPKYYWVDIKYLGTIQNRRWQLFCRCDDSVFFQYNCQFPGRLPRVDLNQKGCSYLRGMNCFVLFSDWETVIKLKCNFSIRYAFLFYEFCRCVGVCWEGGVNGNFKDSGVTHNSEGEGGYFYK